MRRATILAPVLLGAAAIGVVVLATSFHHGPSRDTPIHATAVFFDGIDHGDYRQTCQAWQGAHKHMLECESALTAQMATSAMMGMFGGYKVVPHSEKVWRQPYQGRTVMLATVKVEYVPTRGQKLTAHLKRLHGHWMIWFVL